MIPLLFMIFSAFITISLVEWSNLPVLPGKFPSFCGNICTSSIWGNFPVSEKLPRQYKEISQFSGNICTSSIWGNFPVSEKLPRFLGNYLVNFRKFPSFWEKNIINKGKFPSFWEIALIIFSQFNREDSIPGPKMTKKT